MNWQISRSAWLRLCCICLCSTATSAQAADEFVVFSDEQLLVMQHELANHYTAGSYFNDPVLHYYLKQLNARLGTGQRTFVTVVEEDSINAYAAWGNVIVMHTGLFALTHNEAELAGVLAHEHAHVNQKHFFRIPENVTAYGQLSALALIAALLSGSEGAVKIAAGISGVAQNKQLEVLRRFEREADQQAARNLARAGYQTDDYINLLARLQGPTERQVPEYVLTHPLSENRVPELRAFARRFSIKTTPSDPSDQLDYWLVKQRIKQQELTGIGRKPPIALVPIVTAYATIIRNEANATLAAEQLSSYADNWIIALGITDYQIINGDYKSATSILAQALQKNPSNAALLAQQLRIYALDRDRSAAVKFLAKLSTKLRLNLDVVRAETRLWEALGDEFNYRLAVAHTLYLSGKLKQVKSTIAQIKNLPSADESSSVSGRLMLLEQKVEAMENLLANS